MKFSQRQGLTPTKTDLLRDGIDDAIKASLWSAVTVHFFKYDDYHTATDTRLNLLSQRLYFQFFKRPIDEIPDSSKYFVSDVREWYFRARWYSVLDFIEFIATSEYVAGSWEEGYRNYDNSQEFKGLVNSILEDEKSAYRFVGDDIAPITNETERNEVEEATKFSGKFANTARHISTALALFADRISDNHRNVIKEAISAVESTACVIAEKPKASLGDAFKIISKDHHIHSALKDGILKIYGYTSDASGIRHSLSDDKDADATDAKFMLVACSALCNYLIDRYGKIS